jgi:ribonuclease PH
MTYQRIDKREFNQLRPVSFQRDFTTMALGSVLISMGKTKVLCTASLEQETPRWLKDTNKGWVTAEYSLLPGSTKERAPREAARGRQGGRTLEIQRLIARVLRSVTDLEKLGERQIILDCDVVQADGGTRCASICGAFVALSDALKRLMLKGEIQSYPIIEPVAAVSAGIIEGQKLLDLNYAEDSIAEVDMNFAMTKSGNFVEIQGTAEKGSFSRKDLDELVDLATLGLNELLNVMQDLTSQDIELLPDHI